ncbi:MAG TPA: hypothetical protein VJ801_00950 [Polyangia bacterium]|nr:hypothetical protein [Polyangia bacterium]
MSALHVATSSTMSAVWNRLEHDSSPLLWFLVVRAWSALGLATTDMQLRFLGLCVGAGVLASLWGAARSAGARAPLVSLAMVGLCPSVFRIGDTIRAFGTGALLAVLTVGTSWLLLERPSRWRIAMCAVATLLSVHTLYYSAVLTLAVFSAAMLVALLRRSYRALASFAVIGITSAFSLLPYLETIRRVQTWSIVIKRPVTLQWLGANLARTIGTPLMVGIWLAVAATTLAVCVRGMLRPRPTACPASSRHGRLFFLVALVLGVTGYRGFLLLLGYPTQPWYFVALLVFAAAIFDGTLALPLGASAATARIIAALSVSSLLLGQAWAASHTRHTNVDVAVATVQSAIGPADLLLANPWYMGLPVARVYHGPAPLATVPAMDDLFTHRYDVLKAKMAEVGPIRSTYNRVEATLRAGHRVWVIGFLADLHPGELPPDPPPAPNSRYGWREGAYVGAWSRQLTYFLMSRALMGSVVGVPNVGRVDPHEDLRVYAFQGWR